MQFAKLPKHGHHKVGCSWIAFSLVITLASSSAWAASTKARARAARKACLKGNVDRGAELLIDLFLETKDPNFIYNLGRCYEQNHRYEDAISRFREYLMKSSRLTDEDRAETQKHIDACLGYLGKTETTTPVAPPPQPVAPPPTASPTPTPTPVAVVEQPPAGQDDRAGFGLRVAGIASAAAGAAAVLTGALLNLKVNSMSNDLEAHYSSSTRSTQEGYKTASEVAYGVGAACIVGGAALYYLGWRKGRNSPVNVTLAPSVSPGQLGASLGGSF